jgi:carboxypeptidase C (cathepsin A)
MADACRALTRGLIALAFLSFSPLATPGLAQQDQAQPAATDAEQRPAAGQRGNQKNPTAEPSSGTSERGRGQSFPPGTGGPVQNFPSVGEQHRLPPDSTTKQTITVRGRALNFSATAGSIRLFNGKGEPEADVAYTAYQLDGTEPASRPVTFFLNGGPGASSAWLQVGAAGPWRLNFENSVTTAAVSPELRPNPETWLDFTDLVFIDPVGTGYSRFVATGDDARKALFSIDGDVTELSLVIRRWLEKAGRLMSPKFVVGESYSGIRGPKIVRNLANQQGVGIRGLILVSPALDFRETSGSSLLQYVASLPTMAAVARAAKGPVTRADMADVEHYAAQEFLLDLVKGQADVEATTRLADKFATLTGIDQAVSRRLAGRLDVSEFRRELDRRDGRVTGRYDGTITGFDPSPDSSFYQFEDPSLEPLLAPVTSAVVDLTTRKLNWRPDGSYEVLSGAVNRAWDFGRGLSPAESTTQLRQILAADPKFKLLVAHGLFDLATPYFGSQIQLDQLPAYATPDRVKLVVYPGGHMFYSRDASRKALRDEAEAMMK